MKKRKARKKTILMITLAVLLAIVGASLYTSKAFSAIPEDNCQNLALKKDMVVQKIADIEIIYDGNVKFQDVCTNEWHTSAIRYSNDYNNPSFARWVYPNGTIKGTIDQGYMGGMKLDYVICTDGRTWMYQTSGGGKGYGIGNYKEICNTINF